MKRIVQLVATKMKNAFLRIPTFLEQPWREMKLNAEEIAARRRSRVERGEHNFLWCWQHRGFW
ncbi:hypothetical protein F9K88_03855 [Brucella intermedia]|uniref:Uncharacterized protein n=5 Tax=Brucella TaxID=234 RepID=U4VHV2_9HYPH|nr:MULTISPECIES: hypothetical protein [Brucella/Ochrobactrum group]ERM02462.1 hypothetical protein Q644_16505 [Brucella intermedia 229E]KAB2669343.1 hypothetical protein F9K77_17320 [Ochrobactrum sp. LMG 5442]HCH71043.1 hypothetical protein [Ochrobactrum sp.]KAB2696891.1 hypothetical protein F9K72_01725 [Brucella intermedia]KAB2708343.1 hypothetical protein F9K80_14725 [Brucella intermedia]